MSTAKFDTLSTLDGSQSVPVSTVAQGTARAWVNFNGTGTVAIRAAFNVTSITDNSQGNYTLNFTNAMPDVNYSVAGTNTYPASRAQAISVCPYVFLTTSVQISSNAAATAYDSDFISVQIFR